jgi:amidase
MDHIGLMARSVEDAAPDIRCHRGPRPKRSDVAARAARAVHPQLSRGIRGLRVGFDHRYATDQRRTRYGGCRRAGACRTREAGATIVDATMPDLTHVRRAWYALCISEAAKAHARTFPSRADEYGEGLRIHLEKGLRISAAEITAASETRSKVAEQLNGLLAGLDCFVCPRCRISAQEKDADPTVETNESWRRLVINDIHAKPFDFSGSPTLSMPCGFTADGLPLSVQFVGNALCEATICRIGHAYQQATGWHTRHPET